METLNIHFTQIFQVIITEVWLIIQEKSLKVIATIQILNQIIYLLTQVCQKIIPIQIL